MTIIRGGRIENGERLSDERDERREEESRLIKVGGLKVRSRTEGCKGNAEDDDRHPQNRTRRPRACDDEHELRSET